MKNIDIWYSGLSGRVFMWKSKATKWNKEWVKQFTWEKIDITSKFLFIVGQFFELWTSRVITWWEKESLFIHIENSKEAKQKLIEDLQKNL